MMCSSMHVRRNVHSANPIATGKLSCGAVGALFRSERKSVFVKVGMKVWRS